MASSATARTNLVQSAYTCIKYRTKPRSILSTMTKMIADEENQTVVGDVVASNRATRRFATTHTSLSSRYIDEKLATAAVKSLEVGNLTPIIKEELRLTIQTRRLKKGLDELEVDFREPAEEQLTDTETERRLRRRENNRLAAQKCRAKRRDRAASLEREAHVLETNNNELRDQILELERERNHLHEVFNDHTMGTCGCSSAPGSPEVMVLT